MNRQDRWENGKRISRGIEWTQVYDRPGYTWNPIAGCFHGCTWQMPDGSVTECYAKTVAERIASPAYPEGFEHHYWRPHTLDEPPKVKEPSGIFVGSMADLFGHWVPDVSRQILWDKSSLKIKETFLSLLDDM
jgi:protein gp37